MDTQAQGTQGRRTADHVPLVTRHRWLRHVEAASDLPAYHPPRFFTQPRNPPMASGLALGEAKEDIPL